MSDLYLGVSSGGDYSGGDKTAFTAVFLTAFAVFVIAVIIYLKKNPGLCCRERRRDLEN